MADTRDIIAQSIASVREDGPADGGPEPAESSVENPSEPAAVADNGDEPSAGSSDEGTVETGENAPEKSAAAPVAEPEKPKEDKPADNDDIDKEPSHVADKNGRQVVNRIPQPRVKVMVEKAVAKAVADKDAEYTSKLQQYETRTQEFERIGEIMERQPERFAQMLVQANPAYKAFFKDSSAPAASAAPAKDDPMPQPDSRLADGTPAYSPEGFQRVQDWQARQIEQRVLGQVNERYGWVDQERQAREAQAAAVPQVRALMDDAMRNWDGFKDNYDAILTELRQDTAEAARTGHAPRLSLHDAYRVVMNRKAKEERDAWQKERDTLKGERNKIREEVIAELKGRPTSTATVPSAPPQQAAASGPRSTAEIIRASIAGLKNRGE